MNHSITKKITVTFVLLLAAVMFATLLLNSVFLQKIYTMNKQNTLKNAYEVINNASDDGTLDSDDFEIEFDRISAKSNISMLVMSSDYSIILSTGADGTQLQKQFMEVLFGAKEHVQIIASTENYIMEKTQDERIDGDYLVLFGNLDDGSMVMMRVSMASITESTSISSQFMIYVGIFATIIGIIVIFFITRKITDPILQLTDISERMTHLDFDAKYAGVGDNEIDQLGKHMNQLSSTLETTISELKTANNEMKLDLDRKEQIDEMRKEFLSNVSHELKTPIALIQGYAEGLQECVNDDDENKDFYCEVIVDEAGKMNTMVQKLLTLNQLEFGTDSVVMERFDLNDLIKGVISSMAILLQQQEITVEYEDKKEPLFVWADEFKVEEVLTNYMSNAIHHIDGEKKISISVVPKKDVVHISVFNTGNPIPEEELKKLWEKFYKVDKSHSRQYGGSGIGLSIVKAIMDSFHQQCGVENHENGVEFWFELDTKLSDEE